MNENTNSSSHDRRVVAYPGQKNHNALTQYCMKNEVSESSVVNDALTLFFAQKTAISKLPSIEAQRM